MEGIAIKCVWCGKQWEWDWCQDTVIGLDSVGPFKCSDKPGFKLELFICDCGGSLGVLTTEPRGSDLLVSVREEDENASA